MHYLPILLTCVKYSTILADKNAPANQPVGNLHVYPHTHLPSSTDTPTLTPTLKKTSSPTFKKTSSPTFSPTAEITPSPIFDDDDLCAGLDFDAVTDLPSTVKSWFKSKSSTEAKYGPIACWDISQSSSMYNLFAGKSSFDEDLSRWDTSSITDLVYTFYDCTNFNSDLSKWDTSSVTAMFSTFDHATSFNSDLSKWDTSSVTTFYDMFYVASSFDSNVSPWDVSQATSMYGMFEDAVSFQQSLCWDVSRVIDAGNTVTNMFTNTGGCIIGSCCPRCPNSILC